MLSPKRDSVPPQVCRPVVGAAICGLARVGCRPSDLVHPRPVSRPLPSPFAVVRGVYSSETAPDYPAVARLDARHRVIDCPDRIQWIVQRAEGDRWRSISFHRNRASLIARSGASSDALRILRRLPEVHQ